MASTGDIKILEVCRVKPFSISPESSSPQLSLPLTFLDIYYLKFPPVKRIFFYELSDSTPSFCSSVILPKLKHALSLALSHFLPVAGNLTWPEGAAKPFILFTANDGVSLTVAESIRTNFDRLSGNQVHDAVDSHPLVPDLSTSDDSASVLALQITFFPNKGFSLGYAINHAVLDARSIAMFMKAWAYISRKYDEEVNHPTVLPPQLTPFLDREVVQDPDGLDMEYLRAWFGIKWASMDANPRSLKLRSSARVSPGAVRAIFEFSSREIKKLRERTESQLQMTSKGKDTNQRKPVYLSTFVLAYAYTIVCLVKAKRIASERKILCGFAADCRARLSPPIPANYFGNCVSAFGVFAEAKSLTDDNGVASIAASLAEVIEGLKRSVLEAAKEKLAKYMAIDPSTEDIIWVAGSAKLGVYEVDFGWGRPKKVEITSIDSTGNISMAESKDEDGGVEIGLVLNPNEMEVFDHLFTNGLRDI